MKRFLIISLIFISCYNVERNCSDFRTGVFEFSTNFNDSIIKSTFTRTENFEIELFNEIKDSSSIRWVNECEFILTKLKPRNNQEKRPIRINILRTYGNSYDFEYSQVNNPQKINRGTVRKLSD